MVSVPLVMPVAALPLERRPISLAQDSVQAVPLGPILRSEYSRDSPERGSMTALAVQVGGLWEESNSAARCWEVARV